VKPRRAGVTGAGTTDLVSCRVAGRAYAFEGNDVRFIARADQVARGGDAVACVGTLGGPDPIPVYSLAALLHPSTETEDSAHVIVTGSGKERVGWQVDRIVRGRRDRAPELFPLPALAGPVSRRWFKALVGGGDDDAVEPGLVCSPSGLDLRAQASAAVPEAPTPGTAVFPSGSARGVVALFSSSAVPRCGTGRFAISGRRIVAVAQSLAARVVPGTPSYIVALAAWRGLAVPLLDLSGRPSGVSDGNRGRYLLVRYGAGVHAAVVGIAIDRDVVLHRASEADRALARSADDVPPGVQLFTVGGEAVAFLDLDVLVGLRVASAMGDPRVAVTSSRR
jgi:chemotaxis signal transduction protein